MCGIFGFALQKPVEMNSVFKVLEKLERHKYPSEEKTVGGYGVGVVILKSDGTILCEKIGSVNGSPVKTLSKMCKFTEAAVLIGHVRMPSPEFMETAKFRETAQPYITKCYPHRVIFSAHNGKVENYEDIRRRLDRNHLFESESVQLIDSEVIPHLFEETLKENDYAEALNSFLDSLEGSNTIVMLQSEKDGAFLHFVHKGKTRGLTVWTNEENEIVFCSRKEALTETFASMLVNANFKERISVQWREEKNVKLSLALK